MPHTPPPDPESRAPARARAAAAVVALLASCGESRVEPRWLELRQVRPENEIDVYLNERLVLHFSEPLDPSSVHPRSIRVASESGVEARGRLQVERDHVTFVPAPVLSPELDDGGYLPGTRYTIEIAGFPRPDAVRGESGAMLRTNLRWEFLTVQLAVPRTEQIGYLFEDRASPTRGSALELVTSTVPPHGPLRLVSEEPVDPTTLDAADFKLQQRGTRESGGPPRSEPVPLAAKLVRNDEPEGWGSREAAVIELRPADRLLEPGAEYYLVAEGLKLEDFGRHRMLFRATRPNQNRVRVVRASDADGPAAAVEHLESFSDVDARSGEAARNGDGTAAWDGSGRVEVRFPAAAGDGRDGEPEVSVLRDARDLRALRWSVPAGETCELAAAPGPVVLRSQGRARISGVLARLGGATPSSSSAAAVDELVARAAPATLSELVERIVAEQLDVTVLVCGGDLSLDGRIETDRPLVLAAGGRIVLGPTARIDAPRVHCLDLDATAPVLVSGARASRLAVAVDPPRSATVAGELRFFVRSRPLPDGRLAERWLPGAQAHLHHGAGRAAVRYVPETDPPSAGGAAVDDPVLIDAPRLRLEVELVLLPGADAAVPWDPPWVDDVLLQFEPRTSEGKR